MLQDLTVDNFDITKVQGEVISEDCYWDWEWHFRKVNDNMPELKRTFRVSSPQPSFYRLGDWGLEIGINFYSGHQTKQNLVHSSNKYLLNVECLPGRPYAKCRKPKADIGPELIEFLLQQERRRRKQDGKSFGGKSLNDLGEHREGNMS